MPWRLRPCAGQFEPLTHLSDRELVQLVCAFRLFLPFAHITISTRERAGFRDKAITLGATKISAGVSVGIGGHQEEAKGDGQFEIADTRSVQEIYDAILSQNLQPVMGDYVNPPGYSSMGVVNTPEWRSAQVPSTNTHATATGVARIYRALLEPGNARQREHGGDGPRWSSMVPQQHRRTHTREKFHVPRTEDDFRPRSVCETGIQPPGKAQTEQCPQGEDPP